MNTWTEPQARPRPRGAARPQPGRTRRRPHRTWGQRLLLTLGSVLSVMLFLAAGVLYWGLQRYRAINFITVEEVEAAAPGQPSNWLLVGSDSREGISEDDPDAGAFLGTDYPEGKRTDTMMVARVDPGSRTVDLLSIPRDLWVDLASGGEGRINSAFIGENGPQNLVATVEDVLDIEINNYAEVNFVGFRDVVNAVDGVPIYFRTGVRDTNSGLFVDEPGCYLLDGTQALAFARSRHLQYLDDDGDWRSEPGSDLNRNGRQQFLMSRLADRASGQIGLTNFGTIDGIIRAGGENLVIDDGAGFGDLTNLARSFAGVGGEGVRFHALPVTDFTTSGGAQVLDLNESEAVSTLEIYRGILPAPDPTSFPSAEGADRASFTVEVLNGAGVAGLAGEATTALDGLGFQTGEPGNTAAPLATTTILYPSGSEGAATELGRVLRVAPHFELDETVDAVTLELGADYDGVNDATIAGVTVSTAPAEPAAAPSIEDVAGLGTLGPGPEGTDCFYAT